MPVANGSFETPGADPSVAQGWTVTASVAKLRVAGFGAAPIRGVEGFEWATPAAGLGAAIVTDAAAEDAEDFEEGYGNDGYQWSLPLGLGELATFAQGGTTEGGAAGYGVGSWADAWAGVPVEAAAAEGFAPDGAWLLSFDAVAAADPPDGDPESYTDDFEAGYVPLGTL